MFAAQGMPLPLMSPHAQQLGAMAIGGGGSAAGGNKNQGLTRSKSARELVQVTAAADMAEGVSPVKREFPEESTPKKARIQPATREQRQLVGCQSICSSEHEEETSEVKREEVKQEEGNPDSAPSPSPGQATPMQQIGSAKQENQEADFEPPLPEGIAQAVEAPES